MLNTRKIILFATIAAIVVAAVLVAVVALATKQPQTAPQTQSPASSAPPTAHPGSGATEGSYEDILAFTPELEQHAVDAAIAASSWSSTRDAEHRTRHYEAAYFTPELAASYVPVWESVFDGWTKVSEISTQALTPAINSVTGDPGSRLFDVGVRVKYSGTWHTVEGKTHLQPATILTWRLTVEEATGLVTAVVQPSAGDVAIAQDGRF